MTTVLMLWYFPRLREASGHRGLLIYMRMIGKLSRIVWSVVSFRPPMGSHD